MRVSRWTKTWIVPLAMVLALIPTARSSAQEITSKAVLESIEKGRRYLLKSQNPDGSWGEEGTGGFAVGVTGLCLLALFNTGMTTADKPMKQGLTWLRAQDPDLTYEISLMIQALAAAKDGKRDHLKVQSLVRKLEESQVRAGANDGSWSYGRGRLETGGDRSNGQFAVLGLREAQEMGVPVSLDTWRRARAHWVSSQNPDGSWGYSGGPGGPGSGSMSVAGIATAVITQAMLQAGEKEMNADGTPICCREPVPDKTLEDGCRWLGNNFAVGHNPGGQQWLLYYLYGLERAGRFSGRRFFINNRGERHDWYREGAEYLVANQDRLTGSWPGHGQLERSPVLGSAFALMFLSKGLAPVLINKLEYGPHAPRDRGIAGLDWNRHPGDVRNLTQLISTLDRWPRLLTWQVVDVSRAEVGDLLQAPIVFMHGTEAPQMTPQEVSLLKEYILQGGFLLAVNGCKSAAFDEGFRDLVRRMFPPSEAALRKLDASHPVYRSEYPLFDKETGQPTAELWGADVGCRTSIMYAPDDLSCLWDKWTNFEVPHRPKELSAMITKATKVGVNIVAYVTGREVFNKLSQQELAAQDAVADRVERDLLQIAKLRYSGDWDAAPQALRNLLLALNRTVGPSASTRQRDLQLVDPNLFKYPILYMHGRHDFALGRSEQEKLKHYIEQGGVLIADACCGLAPFDKSFRRLMEQLYPDVPLKRIPPDHELFTSRNGHDLKTVKRREPDGASGDSVAQIAVRTVEPFLEGIEINGRYVVLYSKYDISCALERQTSVVCTG
ncbi:MAG: DUF4159 domain-containing protein, partial [Planctomycetales bacterium]